MENERWLVYLFVQMEKKNQVSNTYFKLAAILLYGCLMGMQKRKLLLNQSFHYKNTQVFWEKNKSDEKEEKKKKQIASQIHKCVHTVNRLWAQSSRSPWLAGWQLFTASRAGGTRRQGEECSASSRSFACTSEPGGWKNETGDGGGIETERCGRRWVERAELDYIRFTLSSVEADKSIPSLEGLHGG